MKKGHAKFQWIQRDHDDGVRFIVDTPLEEAFATLTVALKDAAVRTDEKAASRDALSAVIDFVISTLGFEMARPLWLIEIENRAPRVGNPMNKAAESSLALCLAMVDLKSRGGKRGAIKTACCDVGKATGVGWEYLKEKRDTFSRASERLRRERATWLRLAEALESVKPTMGWSFLLDTYRRHRKG